MPELARQFPDVRFTVAASRSASAALREEGWAEFVGIAALNQNAVHRVRRTLAEQVLLPRLAAAEGADLLHSLANTAPAYPHIPSLVTLHDVIFFRHTTLPPLTTVGLRKTVAAGARHAVGFIAVSEAARHEICDVLCLDEAKFTVVPHGPGRTEVAKPATSDSVRRRYRLGRERVVLTVGAKRPHKNQQLLVHALQSLPADIRLVLAGHPETYDRTLRELARQAGVSDRIRFVDYVSDEDLEGLWGVAAAAALPTLTEGFGLPVLEAMRHGVPVACSDIPALREVGGDVPHYFDPRDPISASSAIEAAIADASAGERGKKRAGLFSWARAAEGTFAAYERALSARS